MKMNFQKIINSFILFVVNILLYHLIFFVGIFVFHYMFGLDFSVFAVVMISGIYALALLIYERRITDNYCISNKTYWVLTLIVPLVIYVGLLYSAFFANVFRLDVWQTIYIELICFLIVVTAVMVSIEKIIAYTVRKIRWVKVVFMNKEKKEWIAAGVVVAIVYVVIFVLFIIGMRSCEAQLSSNLF